MPSFFYGLINLIMATWLIGPYVDAFMNMLIRVKTNNSFYQPELRLISILFDEKLDFRLLQELLLELSI